MLPSHHLIFTDLDGTLLDQRTYSWAAAEEALAEIERQRVPLIFVTSKTRAEVEGLRQKLNNAHPFITENGGGIFIPEGYFNLRLEGARRIARYHCLALGKSYEEVTTALEELSAETGVETVGFHQMTAREIAQNTGLTFREAELARQRDFDEPFFFAGATEQAIQRLLEAARRRGMEVSRGGLFWHLSVGSDKGQAVRRLLQLYRRALPRTRLRSIGLGDSQNDLSFLATVDWAVLLPRPDGSFDSEALAPSPRIPRGAAPGPAGWNQAVVQVLGATGPQ